MRNCATGSQGSRDNMPELERVHTAASRYVQENVGATAEIVSRIEKRPRQETGMI